MSNNYATSHSFLLKMYIVCIYNICNSFRLHNCSFTWIFKPSTTYKIFYPIHNDIGIYYCCYIKDKICILLLWYVPKKCSTFLNNYHLTSTLITAIQNIKSIISSPAQIISNLQKTLTHKNTTLAKNIKTYILNYFCLFLVHTAHIFLTFVLSTLITPVALL